MTTKRATRRPSKIRPVLISQMRVPPALVTQRQFRQAHGDAIAADLDLNKLGFPIINIRDGIPWVLDGQHRIYALKANGFEKDVLDCEVYEGLSDAEAADIFLGRDARKAISAYDKFHVACTAGHRRENDIRRVVEAQGLKITNTKTENSVGCISALCQLYDRSGDTVVGQTVRVLKKAYAGVSAAFDTYLVTGVGLVFNRYNGATNEGLLIEKLGGATGGLLRRAEMMRERTGASKSTCIAAVVIELYNKGLTPKQKLASWWKQADEPGGDE